MVVVKGLRRRKGTQEGGLGSMYRIPPPLNLQDFTQYSEGYNAKCLIFSLNRVEFKGFNDELY